MLHTKQLDCGNAAASNSILQSLSSSDYPDANSTWNVCPPLQEETAFCYSLSSGTHIAVYNPLAHTRDIYVTLNMLSPNVCAYDIYGALLASQTRQSPDNNTSFELAFLADQVPALGFSTYYIKTCDTSASLVTTIEEGYVTLENDYISLSIDASTGKPTTLIDKERDLSLPLR